MSGAKRGDMTGAHAVQEHEIVVLGAGPAGAAVAIGLRRLGYAVTVVGAPRRFRAVEGVSERVVAALRQSGFERAMAAISPPSPRTVTWDGETSALNSERLIDRTRFDALLQEDLRAQGVTVLVGRVVRVAQNDAGHAVDIEGDGETRVLHARFVVEARGRAAAYAGSARQRGAETVSLLQLWQGPARSAASAVENFADGWGWFAAMPDGVRYLQLTLDVATANLPAKAELGAFCRARLHDIAAAKPFLVGAEPLGEPYARTSTPVRVAEVAGANWIRVGDAAMAVDPLSGNGIFQALSSALQAPAVIHTLLTRPQDGELAIEFHTRRVEALFLRFARIGRDFYAQESRWADRPFWQARSGWPDSEPLHAEVRPESVRIAALPVVNHGLIERADVVVTADQPLGIWHLDGVPLAPLLAALQQRPAATVAELAECVPDVAPERILATVAWMRQQHWLD